MIVSANAASDRPAIALFRNDLRLRDNRAFSAAAGSGRPVIALFVLDEISPAVRPAGAARRWWLHRSIEALQTDLKRVGGAVVLRRGEMAAVVEAVRVKTGAGAVFWNRRYDPAEASADVRMKTELRASGIEAESFDGQLLHEPSRLLTGQGGPYRVYGAFRRALEHAPEPRDPVDYPDSIAWFAGSPASDSLADWNLLPQSPDWSMGFAAEWQPGETGAHERLGSLLDGKLERYAEGRDIPASDFTSGLSPHLAHGEITPFQVVARLRRLRDEGQAGRRRKISV